MIMKLQVIILASFALLATVKGQFETSTSSQDKSFLSSAIVGRFL